MSSISAVQLGMIEHSEETILGQVVLVPFALPHVPMQASPAERKGLALRHAAMADKALDDVKARENTTLAQLIGLRSAELTSFWAEYNLKASV